MNIKYIFFLTGCLIYSFLVGQNHDPLLPPNTFQNADNPHYWKNRKPFEGYWQQDVHYSIKANIDEKTGVLSATQQLTYWNNSPDELSFVYFHLYQNAFQPGSYTDALHKANNYPVRYGPYESRGKGTEILKLEIDGEQVQTELDNTILKVYLPTPLKSGTSITFDIDFNTYFDPFGNIRRRMKLFGVHGNNHFDGVHWYPRIAVYDRKFGWTTDQHLTREFYGDFGTFDVELTFANNYVVEATGNLTNEKEVLPAELREKLDIKHFKDKPWNEAPSTVIESDGTKKVWKYHAENVHDFAFTADPTYRIGEITWNGIRCIAVVQESHASKWQNAADYTAKVIQINSEDFGMYAYPKMVVADARDGMEYPMITLDNGYDPTYRGLFVHEISHNWFYGMVGNNETYRACLDEGFTQFLTAWTYNKIDGDFVIMGTPKSKYVQRFKEPQSVRESRVYNGYLFSAGTDEDATLNTHSDHFGGALRHGGGYRQVYTKTATMLYNLQYVLGDELFLKAMQHYFNQWKFCHPYLQDFRNSIIHYTKVDLNWFFDQWLETTKTIDYGVKSVKKGKGKDEFIITFERKGGMQMPIDFKVIGKNGESHAYHIPNTWFVKNTSATVLPRWIGWDKINPTYTDTITIPSGISDLVIDPTYRLADVNMLNNSKKFPLKYEFDSKIRNSPDWKKYELFARPDLWYNGYDGLKVGVHFNGNYLKKRHVFDFNFWFNTGLFQNYLDEGVPFDEFDNVSLRFNYKTSLDKIISNSNISFSGKSLDGLYSGKLGFDKYDRSKNNRLYVNFKSMYRKEASDLLYLLYPEEWETGKFNNTITVGITHKYHYTKGSGHLNLYLRSSSLGSDYDYAHLTLEANNKTRIGKKLELRTRTFAQYGTGNNWAKESSLFLSGANPESLMDNKFMRSQGFIAPDWTAFGAIPNLISSRGGLFLRGYSGYLAPHQDDNGNIYYTYRGTSGASINAELYFNRFFRIKSKYLKKYFNLESYVFGDAGVIDYENAGNKISLSDIRADAGVGLALTIKKWWKLETVEPITIHFDVPLFLNKLPALETNYFSVRYLFFVG